MMGKIHVLSEMVANKIAAGEVVERPASIVKELVENSLDAGADRIEITVKHGGKSLIRVADNGSGMSSSDAELSLQRHATSKITTAEDLDSLASFGFRGEALPSIAAVSRFTLQTRAADASSGTELVVEGGRLTKARECSAAQGTVIEVRDLFFNTPARRKFMKQDSTEFGHILDAVTCLALANLQVRFVLDSGEKKPLDLLLTGDLSVRARAIFGEDWAGQVIPIQNEIPHIKLSGLIGKPSIALGNRTQQFFFINRRWVKAYGLSHGLQAGYHGHLMQNQFPAAVLFLDLDPQYVDVNVHPTKQQVRLSHEALIKSLIEKTVSGALKEHGDLAPSFKTDGGRFPSPAVHFQESKFSFEETMVAEGATLKVSEASFEEAVPAQAPVFRPLKIGKGPQVLRVLGQVHRTYILAETEEGYIIVDQHAAHERVMFEAILKNFESERPAIQGLLMEEILELHPRQVEILKKHLVFLNKIGFEIEPFGEKAFVVRGLPSAMKDENPVTLIKQFVDEKEAGKSQTGLRGYQENIAALIACKRRSVKAADALTFPAMQGLIEQLARCENPFNCPHGRPSFIRYSAAELEKQFKRKL
ncbi:MAG TPA: DNA mismatch repair endonuclease MutL [Candidatus Omnitrophota bacterium]|nr:DNA mismatch repair endonuclease MutL [Candidatus Omnitrophota bacterium]